mmetsp:Transcript_15213/g.65149  ORF Transcript_15213/g.65149 Transcript_15213/m.65149 type:complete len:211 (+) Transcript_15213:859-1491(+)
MRPTRGTRESFRARRRAKGVSAAPRPRPRRRCRRSRRRSPPLFANSRRVRHPPTNLSLRAPSRRLPSRSRGSQPRRPSRPRGPQSALAKASSRRRLPGDARLARRPECFRPPGSSFLGTRTSRARARARPPTRSTAGTGICGARARGIPTRTEATLLYRRLGRRRKGTRGAPQSSARRWTRGRTSRRTSRTPWRCWSCPRSSPWRSWLKS